MIRNKHLYLAALTSAMGAGGLASMAQSPIAAAAATVANEAGRDLADPLTEEQLEQRVEALAPAAPRITKEHIQSLIVDETYTNLEGTRTTVCRLQLANGFCVVGINNGPVSAANFDQALGCEYAYKAAVDQIWPLEGYLLAERLFAGNVHAEKLAQLRDLVAIQCAPGTVDAGEYMRGMANGLILAVSVFDGQEPQFVGFNLPDPKGSTHQERVGIERAELDARAEKLEQFIHGDVFTTLPADEQERLLKQHGLMAELSGVLSERIAHFPA